MSEKLIPYGGAVEYTTDGGTTWVPVIGARALPVPTTTTDYKDVTDLQSPNRFREYIKGLRDAGEVTVPCWYTPGGYAALAPLEAQDEAVGWKVTFPQSDTQLTAGDVFEFSGFPTIQIPTVGAPDDAQEMNIVLRITGDVTYTAGA